jgi:glutathione S-transferase
MPAITLHGVASSHPVLTVEAALRHKGLPFEREDFPIGDHGDQVAAIYGEGARTVPGMLVDGEPVHGSVGILRRLEELVPEPALYPADVAEQVRETEEWGSAVVQSMARHFVFGALHFRPESMGTFAGGGPLDPAGTDFAITYVRRAWRHVGITAAGLAAQLAELPAVLDRTDALAEAGVLGGEQPTAADLQLGSSYQLMLNLGDLVPLLEGRTAETIARRWFGDYPGAVPAGAFPAGWVPEAASTPAR